MKEIIARIVRGVALIVSLLGRSEAQAPATLTRNSLVGVWFADNGLLWLNRDTTFSIRFASGREDHGVWSVLNGSTLELNIICYADLDGSQTEFISTQSFVINSYTPLRFTYTNEVGRQSTALSAPNDSVRSAPRPQRQAPRSRVPSPDPSRPRIQRELGNFVPLEPSSTEQGSGPANECSEAMKQLLQQQIAQEKELRRKQAAAQIPTRVARQLTTIKQMSRVAPAFRECIRRSALQVSLMHSTRLSQKIRDSESKKEVVHLTRLLKGYNEHATVIAEVYCLTLINFWSGNYTGTIRDIRMGYTRMDGLEGPEPRGGRSNEEYALWVVSQIDDALAKLRDPDLTERAFSRLTGRLQNGFLVRYCKSPELLQPENCPPGWAIFLFSIEFQKIARGDTSADIIWW